MTSYVPRITAISLGIAFYIFCTDAEIRKLQNYNTLPCLNFFSPAEYIKVCSQNDPHIAVCINNSIEEIRPRLLKGIPELDVPPLEPLSLQEITLQRGPDGAKIEATVKNIKVKGPGTFIIKSLRYVCLTRRFQITGIFQQH